jgi:hypothetical protein
MIIKYQSEYEFNKLYIIETNQVFSIANNNTSIELTLRNGWIYFIQGTEEQIAKLYKDIKENV